MQAKSKGKILVIDPQQDRAREIRQQLILWGYQARVCAGHLQALAWLDDEDFDLALVEVEESDIEGLEFCRLLRRREGQSPGGFRTWLLLLGAEEDRLTISCSDAGADDFLLRPFLAAELGWRLRSGLEKQELLGNLQRALRLEPDRPVLNRSGLYYTLQRELNRSSRKDKRFSILLILLQGLNLAELNFGPAWAAWMEDRLLQTLEARLRNYDKLGALARWQWCLLVPESSFADMQGLRDRLDKELQGVLQQELQEAGGIEFCFQGLNLQPNLQYWTVNQGLDSLWAWILEVVGQSSNVQSLQAGQLTPEGILLEDW
ncbi:MAG: response regulator transcription factor [Thermodesulfobacteriota bacterium]